jgi:hypothetical protein
LYVVDGRWLYECSIASIAEFLMRFFVMFFLALLLLSSRSQAVKPCPGEDYLRLVSGVFCICMPSQFYKNATIGSGLVVKLSDGSFFGVEVITAAQDSLPETFDMQLYPEYAFGLQPPSGMPAEQKNSFLNSINVLKDRFGSVGPQKYKNKQNTIYSVSNGVSTTAYVTTASLKKQVLIFNFEKVDEKTVKLILEGVQ